MPPAIDSQPLDLIPNCNFFLDEKEDTRKYVKNDVNLTINQ